MTEDDLRRMQDGLLETAKTIMLEQDHLRSIGFVITLHKHVDKLLKSGWGAEILDPKECLRDAQDDSNTMLIVDLMMDPKRLYHAVLNLFPKARNVLPDMIALGKSIGIGDDDTYMRTMRAFLSATELNEKDIISATMRQICGQVDAFACVLHSEAWQRTVDPSDTAAIEAARKKGLGGDMKAIEVIFSTMETHTFARTITVPVQREPSQDPNKRDAGKVLGFGAIAETGGMEGRMSGFLKPLETAS